jgi:hypothetical protein
MKIGLVHLLKGGTWTPRSSTLPAMLATATALHYWDLQTEPTRSLELFPLRSRLPLSVEWADREGGASWCLPMEGVLGGSHSPGRR